MRWRIWYADGTTADGVRRSRWANLPNSGILGVATKLRREADGSQLGRYATGGDWYWWADDGIESGETTDIVNHWVKYDGPWGTKKDAKLGSWADDGTFERVLAEMVDWMNGG